MQRVKNRFFDRECAQVVTDYTDVNTENSSVRVYVRARPPDPDLILQDDEVSVEDKFQNPLQATLAGALIKYTLYPNVLASICPRNDVPPG